MLNQAIAAARGEPAAPDKSDCLVDITVDAYLPESYIPDAAGRIEAYKKLRPSPPVTMPRMYWMS